MLQISLKSEYGLLFLLTLARRKGECLSLTKISSYQKLPYRYLSQIAIDLKNAGLVESREGARGGYSLTKHPQDVKLSDVITILDGETGLIQCQRGKSCALSNTCQIKGVWQKIQTEIGEVLRKYTIQDLL